MSLSIVVNGGGTFTASMEEGPVSFTASLAAVGPQGPAGAAGQGVPVGGTTGQVLAKASDTNYDTEWVARNPFNQELNTTYSVSFEYVNVSNAFGIDGGDVLFKDSLILSDGVVSTQLDTTQGLSLGFGGITFPDTTAQTTALPSGTADGNIVAWDEDTSTYLSVPNDARTLFLNGTNKTGTTIAKGKAVYISGATGNHPEITLAQANSEATSARTIGITSEAIANNGTGRVIVAGLLENVDTSAFTAGDVLYLSSSSAGGFQTTIPTQPNHGVLLGYVTRSNNSTGVIEVRVDNYQELGEQSDVLLTSKTNLDLLSYETSSGLWKNKSFSTLGLLTSATAASTYSALASTNTFTASQVIEVTDNSNAALRVTQLGTGEAFRVEDSANPDSSPFVITADGRVGIGRSDPGSYILDVASGVSRIGGTLTVSGNGSTLQTTTIFAASNRTDPPLTITNAGSGASFRVNDESSDTTPFIVDAGGNVGVKTASPSTDFEVVGNAKATTITIGSSAALTGVATDAEAVAGTSATLAVTPANLRHDYRLGWILPDISGTTAVTSTGTTAIGSSVIRVNLTASASGQFAYRYFVTGAGAGTNVQPVGSTLPSWNPGARNVLQARVVIGGGGLPANLKSRYTFGKSVFAAGVGDLSVKGFGIRIDGTSVYLQVHDGTTLTEVLSSHTISGAFDCIVESLGTGTVNLIINGSQVATTTAGATGSPGVTYPIASLEIESTASSTAGTVSIMSPGVFMS